MNPGTELYRQAKADGLIEDDERSIYERNFQMVESNYYNLALFCHSLNLPRPLLAILTRRSVFMMLSREPMNRFCGRLLDGLTALRLWTNKRLYSRRRVKWLVQEGADQHA